MLGSFINGAMNYFLKFKNVLQQFIRLNIALFPASTLDVARSRSCFLFCNAPVNAAKSVIIPTNNSLASTLVIKPTQSPKKKETIAIVMSFSWLLGNIFIFNLTPC